MTFVTDATIAALLDRAATVARAAGVPCAMETIGRSRAGRPLYGIRLGRGPARASLTAGAHADEPAGPMAAFDLIRRLCEEPRGKQLVDLYSFYLCPQVNPDGAEANSAWFRDPADLALYLRHVVREQPGDDVEFGYPAATAGAEVGAPPLRPENGAVAEFLRHGAPYVFHASLHGMAFAEGAWFLIGARHAGGSAALRARLARMAQAAGLPLHDMDRHGEKGFTRIAPGFCTTPHSEAMREFFLARGDPATAALFRPSSMEFVQSLGGDPLVMVSEIPVFLIGGAAERPDPPPPDTAYARLREALPAARAAALAGDSADIESFARRFAVRPVPFATQTALITGMVMEALDYAAGS
ncbi:MAG: M14 family zinc carboxypeptidase [Candidatus Sumerlaeaceae bacterium]|nr:M14 family zinc carboxypeptidase [Candidatus Sumerlaeaceae bacterium]